MKPITASKPTWGNSQQHGKKLSTAMKKQQPSSKLMPVEDENVASLDYLNQMVEKYREKGRMDVFDMRKNIRVLTCVLFYAGKFHPMRKSRGLWQQPKPIGWPVGVPFVDPNNSKKDPYNQGKKSKPDRNLLAAMIEPLIKIFVEQREKGTLILPDAALDEIAMPVQTSDGFADIRNSVSIRETPFINPGYPTQSYKAVNGPTEVSGDKAGKVQQIVDGLKANEWELLDQVEGLVLENLERNKPLKDVYGNTEHLLVNPFDQMQQKMIDQVKDEPLSPAQAPAQDVHELMNVLSLRDGQKAAVDESNPLKQHKYVLVKQGEQTPSQYVQDEGFKLEGFQEINSADTNILPDFDDQDLALVNDLFPAGYFSVEEQNPSMGDSFPQYEYQAMTAPQHQHDVNINVQTRQVDEGYQAPAAAAAQPIQSPPPTMVDITNMDVEGMPKSNHGELATGRHTAPMTFSASATDRPIVQSSDSTLIEQINVTAGNNLYQLSDGRYINVQMMMAEQPTPPPPEQVVTGIVQQPMTTDILSQAAMASQIFPEPRTSRQVVTESEGRTVVGQAHVHTQSYESHNPLAFGLPDNYTGSLASLPSPGYPVMESQGNMDTDMMDCETDPSMIPTIVEEMTVDLDEDF